MPHELLDSQVFFEGRIFTLVRQTYRLPDGRTRAYELVRHHGAVTLVPVDPQGRILFVRQYRVGAESELLELPAGVLHAGEDPAEGAARELREETGMAAGVLTRLGDFYMAPGYSSEHMVVYLAEQLTPDPLPQDDDEFLDLVAVPVAEALRMAREGDLRDGKSLAALLMAQSRLG